MSIYNNNDSENNENNENNNNENKIKSFEKWDQLENIKDDLLRGIYAIGFETPSPIQQKAIIPMFEKNDVVAQAQSGTGKTGAFSVSTLNIIDITQNKTQALLLAPTRELALQTSEVITSLGEYMNGLKVQLLVGGTSVDEDIRNLKNNTPHIIVGCPGRTHDMMKKNHVNNSNIKLIILDEADEMLCVGFKEQVYNIFQFLNKDVQVGLFSATLPYEINSLTDKFMRNPVKILVKDEDLTLEGIKQFYINLEHNEYKYETLCDLYDLCSVSQTIIYCNSRTMVEELYRRLGEDNFSCVCMHGDLSQEDRNQIMSEFRNGTSRILISTDLLSRGIDVQQVSLVINYDIPNNIESYIHRIGRSGRYGRKGTSINFLTRYDIKKMKDIEEYYHTIIEELPSDFKL